MKPKDRARVKRLEALQPLTPSGGGGGGVTPNPFWLRVAWFIDPQNRTGLASDSNDGATPTTPVLTWNKGVIQRYGTNSPTLGQDTTWTFLSGTALAETDPIIFSPTATNGSQLVFQGTLVAANKIGSGILAGVIAKDYVAGQLLTADLGSAGPVGVNQLVVNTTAGKSSAAFTFANVAGTTFNLSQALTRTTLPLSIPTFVDTWANGDTFDVYLLDSIEMAQFTPTFADSVARAYIQQLGFEASTAGSPFYWGNGVALQESRIDRRAAMYQGAPVRSTYCVNCAFTDIFGINGGASQNAVALLVDSVPTTRILGGFAAVTINGAVLDGNVILTPAGGGGSAINGCLLGTVYVQAGLVAQGSNTFGAFLFDGPRFWGPARYEIEEGHTFLTASAVSIFLNTMSPKIIIGGSSGFAFTATRANPSVINGNVPITPATIDAQADPAGVGMYVPGVGGLSNTA
jgi:hypothetical protein